MSRRAVQPAPVSDAAVVTKAVLRAAEHLGLANRILGRVLGLSEASVSRMGSGSYSLAPGEKPYELGVLFVRLFRGLDAIASGDTAVARSWLHNENSALGERPVSLIQTVAGLVHVVEYLDTRRALV